MNLKEITSLQHPLIKHLVQLRQSRSYRYSSKRVVISGLKLIQELSSTIHFHTLLVEKGSALAPPADLIVCVTPEILKKVTGLQTPEPIAAEVSMPECEDLARVNHLLVLDGVSDPGNLGTLLRSACAFGWEGVFLTPGSTDPFNDKALRSAKGATFKLALKQGNCEELRALLEAKKMPLFAAEVSGKDFSSCSISPPVALALGNEAHGFSPELKALATPIGIPMKGRMESLNVAAAGSILMSALRRSQA